jgi:chromosome segregation ATPase
MADPRASDHLALARDLEQRDIDVAARLDAVAAVLGRVDGVRARATRVRVALEGMPGKIEHAERDERDARAREAEARAELDEAERRFADVSGSRRASEDAKVEAERALRRAMVAASDAATSAAKARGRLEDLVREEAALQAEGEGLAVEARSAADEVAAVPRVSESGRTVPGTSLGQIEEWGARAHAALFVVRGSLESERERLVLEANSLAAAAFGDHGGGASVGLVRRRLEEWAAGA